MSFMLEAQRLIHARVFEDRHLDVNTCGHSFIQGNAEGGYTLGESNS